MIKNWTGWKNLAKLNIFKTRVAQYLSAVNFLMIGKVFVETFENRNVGWSLLISGIIALLIFGYFDYKYIVGLEQEIYWKKNKAFAELMQK